jgi:hypothetical protein
MLSLESSTGEGVFATAWRGPGQVSADRLSPPLNALDFKAFFAKQRVIRQKPALRCCQSGAADGPDGRASRCCRQAAHCTNNDPLLVAPEVFEAMRRQLGVNGRVL